jgi:hypothetical protein
VTACVMVCRGMAGYSLTNEPGEGPAGQFLKSYDPEAHQGRGDAEWTRDLQQAMVFPSQLAAWATWSLVPVSRPRRPDGRFNKPLTAFTIEIVSVGEVEDGEAGTGD